MKFIIPCVSLAILLAPGLAAAATLVTYTFPAVSSLSPTFQASDTSSSAIGLSSSTITQNVTTGADFANEPYIQGSGWTATSQAAAKYFTFTITADTDYLIDITGISFSALATGAGPSALGVSIGSSAIGGFDLGSATLLAVSQPVSGYNGLSSVEIRIQGWLNGSRSSTGSGDLRIDDLVVEGRVAPVPEPGSCLLGALGALGLLRRRR
jgi:hypothetical protein